MKRPKSKTLSPESARVSAQLFVALTALVVVTCSGAARSVAPGPAAAEPKTQASPSPVLPPPASVPVVPSAELATTQGGAAGDFAGEAHLDRFRAALRNFAQGEQKESIRVLWLGDSHAAADFWPDAIRKPLQERYGLGGPGFLHAGLTAYRHSGVKLERDGPWRVEPRQPSLWTRQNDGVFGLGGMRAVPTEARSRATLTLSPDAVRGDAHWDLAFRLPDTRARFRVRVDGGESLAVDAKKYPVGVVAHLEWTTKSGATVVIDSAANEPEVLGVIVESATPGVVVDTLGINGARIGTPLAWEEQPWVDAAARRHPSLVILAYGTNEVGDQVAPFRYGAELEALVARVRKAAPEADCLIVGPTDRAAPDWTTLPRVADIDTVERRAAEHVGCAFFSAYQSMGGDGGLKRWANLSPALAGSDHVHLTPRGYAELGGSMSRQVLGEPLAPLPRAAN